MAVRVTQQWAEVLRNGIADVRVTRQYLEVLVVSGEISASCIESITVEDAVGTDTFTPEFIESITVGDTARASFMSVAAVETIVISDAVGVVADIETSITESITVDSVVTTVLSTDIEKISESITIGELLDGELNGSAIVSRVIEESITLGDSIVVANLEKSVQVVEYFEPDDLIPKTRLVTEPITGQLIEETYIDYSSIQDILETELIRGTATYTATVTENVAVYDVADAEASPSVADNVTVTDSIDIEINVGRTITESIVVGETLRYEIVSNISLCTYSPFIGGSSNPDAPTPPSSSAPAESAQGDFELYYPVAAPTLTLTLTGPAPDDRESLRFQRVKRTSRGLALQIYADPQWPKVKRLVISVDVCTEEKAQEILDFMITTTGQEIGFRDWRNQIWQGIVTNPQNPVVRDQGSWTVSIEFEAEL